MSELAERLDSIQSRIAKSCDEIARKPDSVTLIVVTKNHPAKLVLDLLQLGVRDFGENRNQEAEPKALEISEQSNISREEYRWHFVGQLQSNKVKNALKYTDVLHSLDRVSLLDAVTKEVVKTQKQLDVFIQLNLTENPQRGGIQLADLEDFATRVLDQPLLNLQGVMGVASLNQEPERDFELIQQASQRLLALAPGAKSISAGMSDDFEIALKFGATHLRIGTAITGNRVY